MLKVFLVYSQQCVLEQHNKLISWFETVFQHEKCKNPIAYKHDKQGKGLPNKCSSERYAQRSKQL